ncbi:hypothetical protein [Haloferula sp. A504]|uniref:hypothetical protein n=1 Tax=Haloferula sp. A504 TaxID=3373601 RepID=UPI0031C0176F|nr:hypothetical protein [Verrucomicrobiaceae bacterium E54]
MPTADPEHAWEQDACPHLPAAVVGMSFRDVRVLGECRDERFYEATLSYGQCLWRRGLPAQAILQLDRAWGADLTGDEAILRQWPSPYRALAWMLERRAEGRFLGNPVRHFQHLASRVRGERREVRAWRAWACLHLSEQILPADGFPRDERQIEREELIIPGPDEVKDRLQELGWPGEARLWGETGSGTSFPRA